MVEAFLLSLAPTRNGMYRTGLFTSSAADTLWTVRVFHRVDFHLTGFCTFSTTDTFRRIRCLYRIHIHRADMRTFTTMYTFSHIHIHMKKADFIQKSIDCSQRTHHFAEKPADTQTSHQCDHQDYHFHGK